MFMIMGLSCNTQTLTKKEVWSAVKLSFSVKLTLWLKHSQLSFKSSRDRTSWLHLSIRSSWVLFTTSKSIAVTCIPSIKTNEDDALHSPRQALPSAKQWNQKCGTMKPAWTLSTSSRTSLEPPSAPLTEQQLTGSSTHRSASWILRSSKRQPSSTKSDVQHPSASKSLLMPDATVHRAPSGNRLPHLLKMTCISTRQSCPSSSWTTKRCRQARIGSEATSFCRSKVHRLAVRVSLLWSTSLQAIKKP